ncbi:MAG: hypothetical protein NXI14_05975 [bacterium]|nr:hypothetical protein [bacterium]
MDQFVILPVVLKNGETRPTNFRLDDLRFFPPEDADAGIRRVETRFPFGVHRVKVNAGDTLTVRDTPDDSAFDLAKFRGS